MTFTWTKRQFVGGALCLDFANTVIYPTDPARRADRLRTTDDVERWTDAAAAEIDTLSTVRMPWPSDDAIDDLIEIRNRIDRVFRAVAAGGDVSPRAFRHLIGHYRDVLSGADVVVTTEGLRTAPRPTCDAETMLSAAILQSSLDLAFSAKLNRIKACTNCGWLFVDRSNARRRRWCDMRSCGNQAKALTHYRRTRSA